MPLLVLICMTHHVCGDTVPQLWGAGDDPGSFIERSGAEANWSPEFHGDSDLEAPKRSLRMASVGVTKFTGGKSFMKSIVGMLIGWFLLPFSFALLMVNEQNHARMVSLIAYAKSSVQETPSTDTELNHKLDWKLVSTNGTTTTKSVLSDPDFVDKANVEPRPEVKDSVKLNRKLEIYQNVEKKATRGDGGDERTTYWVEQEWCSSYQDSSGWQPENKDKSNPPLPGYAKDDGFDKTWYAERVDMGVYEIPKPLMEKVDNWEDMGDWCYPDGRKDAPQVGDARLKWSKCPCGPTSVVALQDDGGSFRPYRIISRLGVCSESAETKALQRAAGLSDEDYAASLRCPIPCICCLCDLATAFLHTFAKAEVYFIKAGVAQGAAESMTDIANSETCMAVCCRFTGWILMFASVMMIANPLVKAIAFIPFIGPFFASMLHITVFLVAFFMTLFLSAIVISIAYILVRPLLTVTLIVVVCGAFVLGSKVLPHPDNPEAGSMMVAGDTSLYDAAIKLKLL